ncbi:MAG: hypothetical protein ACR2KB_02220 [Chitinophagaceae bacterium]
MKILNIVLILASITLHSNAQNKVSPRASQLQLEVLGPGGLLSVNFDSRFLRKEKGLGYKIGLGGAPLGVLGKSCNSGGLLTLPAGITYLAGNNKHKIELGGGGVMAIVNATKRYCPDFDADFFSDETGPYGYISAGYRFQPVAKKGLTYRIFLSPLFQSGFNPKFWGGASLGYRW